MSFGGAITLRSFKEMEPIVGAYFDAGGTIMMPKPRMHELDENRIDETIGLFLEVCGKFGMKMFVHPFESRSRGGQWKWLVANDEKDMELMVESYTRLMQRIKGKEGVYPMLITHGGRMHVPSQQINGKDRVSLGDAIFHTAQYLKKLHIAKKQIFGDEEFTIVIENMPAPGRNKGEEPVLYTMNQIADFIKFFDYWKDKDGKGASLEGGNGSGFGVCLDVGHLQLSGKETVMKYILAGLPIRCTHLHGNDGTDDQHNLPYRENLERVKGLEKFLLDDKIVNIIEINRQTLLLTNPRELKRVMDSLKKGRLPLAKARI